MSRKRLMTTAIAFLLTVSLAACNTGTASSTSGVEEQSTQETPSTSQDAGKEGAEPASGHYVEVLRIGTTRAADSFNITSEDGSYGKMNYNSFSAAPFLELDNSGQLQPHIMTGWEIAEDQMSVTATFATDQGVQWHDGTPLTMDDIVFSFNFWKDVKQSGYVNSLSQVEQIDDTTLKLIFDTPAAYSSLNKMARFCYVYPKHIWESVENYKEYTGEDAVIGCGPYKLVDVDQDAQMVTYEAVDHYFKGELTVKKVIVRSYDSHDALVMALRSDEIDAMYDYSNSLDSSMRPSITGIENLDEGMSVNPGNFQMVFGFNVAPTNDPAFRQAVAAALDYPLLATAIGGEDGEVAGAGVVSPAALGYDPSFPLNQQDVEKATSILDEAGYVDKDGDGLRELPDGGEMTILVTPQFNQTRSALYLRICEITIENLKAVGVNAVLDEESVRNQDYANEFRSSGQYQIYIGYTSPGVALYDSAFMYMVPREGNAYGTCSDEDFVTAYNTLMNSNSYEDYNKNSSAIQKLAADKTVGIALCWDRAYFPHRTDKYTGWVNYSGWGAINSETWYALRPR